MDHTSVQPDALLSAEENRRMFDALVPRYDRLNALLSLGLHRRWRRCTVALLGPVAGTRYLDVGTGTGDLCIEILRREPAAQVIGIDPSAAMLARARSKFARLGMADQAQAVLGDAGSLPYPDGSLGGIVSGFCIRNLTARDGAFREMHRVTGPGGRIALLELTRPIHPLLRLGHRLYGRIVVPMLGQALSRGDAYRYLTRSIEAFAAPAVIVEELRQAGFDHVIAQPLSGGVVTVFSGRRPDDARGGPDA